MHRNRPLGLATLATLVLGLPLAAETPSLPPGGPSPVPASTAKEIVAVAAAGGEDRGSVTPQPGKGTGWSVCQTRNFLIFHRRAPELADAAGRAAERARAAALRRWFDAAGDDWSPRCALYLHDTTRDYCRDTGVQAGSPGHSTIRTEDGRVLSRRIDLCGDSPLMLSAVLPHEVTHVVMAGRFAGRPVPVWANEGMAVLSEPAERVERHLRDLPRYRREGRLFSARDLIEFEDYPDRQEWGVFYAQSVSLVQFLSNTKGPQTFARFMGEGLRHGYEKALKRHYGWDFDDLEQRWQP